MEYLCYLKLPEGNELTIVCFHNFPKVGEQKIISLTEIVYGPPPNGIEDYSHIPTRFIVQITKELPRISYHGRQITGFEYKRPTS
ncbi:hypothetical protein A2V49_01555 [candidate division WWE3 bacterium RBG_19FT_COMBO_34_6]|uniref:Uncharacterized protein n=1 Tax=candidate division WWE3 bacterium RBG_19FT_COMBO_34_6 TaxID=1802612 RepID=A0A1F4UK26_UNCKA|nr:MAG: hypothetical protein A2V49_01555 [candidate division WWE3 bacterium RBG_19FT_COMBO_34_6]